MKEDDMVDLEQFREAVEAQYELVRLGWLGDNGTDKEVAAATYLRDRLLSIIDSAGGVECAGLRVVLLGDAVAALSAFDDGESFSRVANALDGKAFRVPPAPHQQPAPTIRDRELDRKHFTDASFNEWLDTGISDAGHTVWDAIGDTQAAWAGWDARPFAGDAVMLSECCGREECGGECGNDWLGMRMYRKPTEKPAPVVDDSMVERAWLAGMREYARLSGGLEDEPDATDLAAMRAAVNAALSSVQGVESP